MATDVIRIHIKRAKPKNKHVIWNANSGDILYSNLNTDDGIYNMPVKYTVKSENWWPFQNVTNLKGEVEILDVFEYGDLYVIMRDNGDKIAVKHDKDNNWHITLGGK